MKSREFTTTDAKRESFPLLIGLMGASGSGKTYSALRIASGITSVTGGDIYFIDTENRRSLQYADKFKFKLVDFQPPFSPLDYLAAINHCVKSGAKVIIVDSMSHEHEGQGGVLDIHEEEHKRLGGSERVKMLAWAKPKAMRSQLLREIVRINCNIIFCFRAKKKVGLPKKGSQNRDVVDMGYMPVGGDDFVFEMTASFLLPPGSRGVPDLSPEDAGERVMVKITDDVKSMLKPGQHLDEKFGRDISTYAGGIQDDPQVKKELISELRSALEIAGVTTTEQRLNCLSGMFGRKIESPEQLSVEELRTAIAYAVDKR